MNHQPSDPHSVRLDLANAHDLSHKLDVILSEHDRLSIHELTLNHNQPNDWLAILPTLLKYQPQLVTLDLAYNKLNQVDPKLLQALLQACSKLSRLDLSANGFNKHFLSYEPLFQSQIADLDMSYNPLGDEGVQTLIDPLENVVSRVQFD